MTNRVYRPGTGRVLASYALLTFTLLGSAASRPALFAQAPAAPVAAANRALGTVKSISGSSLTVTTDAGAMVSVTLADGVRVQQLAPGSTDLKTAQAGTVDAIAAGDRVLVSGTPGDPGALTATRVILMKSADIAQRNQSTQADWNRRGSGGIVTSLDPATGSIAISSGTRKVTVETKTSTMYRRYAPGSVKFEEAKPGTLADLHPGDQLRVRGDRSADGLTVTAEEIVSGSFKNLSGTVISINAAANSFVIKDLATKKNETVAVGTESDLRALPPEAAARFAAPRTRPGTGAAGPTEGGTANGAAPAGAGTPAGETDTSAAKATPGGGAGRRPGGYGAGTAPGAGYAASSGGGRTPGGRGSGADLSQMIPRLPKSSLADLKTGEALMIVASGNSGGPYTAITVLSGVEALLTGPAGSEITLPPWSSGAAGGGEAGGGGPE